MAQSLRAVSPGSRHDAETLDLLSRNHSETHLWETKGNKLGHSRRSNPDPSRTRVLENNGQQADAAAGAMTLSADSIVWRGDVLGP